MPNRSRILRSLVVVVLLVLALPLGVYLTQQRALFWTLAGPNICTWETCSVGPDGQPLSKEEQDKNWAAGNAVAEGKAQENENVQKTFENIVQNADQQEIQHIQEVINNNLTTEQKTALGNVVSTDSKVALGNAVTPTTSAPTPAPIENVCFLPGMNCVGDDWTYGVELAKKPGHALKDNKNPSLIAKLKEQIKDPEFAKNNTAVVNALVEQDESLKQTVGTQTSAPISDAAKKLLEEKNKECSQTTGLCPMIDPDTLAVVGWVPSDKAVFGNYQQAIIARSNLSIGDTTTQVKIGNKTYTLANPDFKFNITAEEAIKIKELADKQKIGSDTNNRAVLDPAKYDLGKIQKQLEDFEAQRIEAEKAIADQILQTGDKKYFEYLSPEMKKQVDELLKKNADIKRAADTALRGDNSAKDKLSDADQAKVEEIVKDAKEQETYLKNKVEALAKETDPEIRAQILSGLNESQKKYVEEAAAQIALVNKQNEEIRQKNIDIVAQQIAQVDRDSTLSDDQKSAEFEKVSNQLESDSEAIKLATSKAVQQITKEQETIKIQEQKIANIKIDLDLAKQATTGNKTFDDAVKIITGIANGEIKTDTLAKLIYGQITQANNRPGDPLADLLSLRPGAQVAKLTLSDPTLPQNQELIAKSLDSPALQLKLKENYYTDLVNNYYSASDKSSCVWGVSSSCEQIKEKIDKYKADLPPEQIRNIYKQALIKNITNLDNNSIAVKEALVKTLSESRIGDLESDVDKTLVETTNLGIKDWQDYQKLNDNWTYLAYSYGSGQQFSNNIQQAIESGQVKPADMEKHIEAVAWSDPITSLATAYNIFTQGSAQRNAGTQKEAYDKWLDKNEQTDSPSTYVNFLATSSFSVIPNTWKAVVNNDDQAKQDLQNWYDFTRGGVALGAPAASVIAPLAALPFAPLGVVGILTTGQTAFGSYASLGSLGNTAELCTFRPDMDRVGCGLAFGNTVYMVGNTISGLARGTISIAEAQVAKDVALVNKNTTFQQALKIVKGGASVKASALNAGSPVERIAYSLSSWAGAATFVPKALLSCTGAAAQQQGASWADCIVSGTMGGASVFRSLNLFLPFTRNEALGVWTGRIAEAGDQLDGFASCADLSFNPGNKSVPNRFNPFECALGIYDAYGDNLAGHWNKGEALFGQQDRTVTNGSFAKLQAAVAAKNEALIKQYTAEAISNLGHLQANNIQVNPDLSNADAAIDRLKQEYQKQFLLNISKDIKNSEIEKLRALLNTTTDFPTVALDLTTAILTNNPKIFAAEDLTQLKHELETQVSNINTQVDQVTAQTTALQQAAETNPDFAPQAQTEINRLQAFRAGLEGLRDKLFGAIAVVGTARSQVTQVPPPASAPGASGQELASRTQGIWENIQNNISSLITFAPGILRNENRDASAPQVVGRNFVTAVTPPISIVSQALSEFGDVVGLKLEQAITQAFARQGLGNTTGTGDSNRTQRLQNAERAAGNFGRNVAINSAAIAGPILNNINNIYTNFTSEGKEAFNQINNEVIQPINRYLGSDGFANSIARGINLVANPLTATVNFVVENIDSVITFAPGILRSEGQQKTTLSDGSSTELRTNVVTPDPSLGIVARMLTFVNKFKGVDSRGVAPPQPDLTDPERHWSEPTPLSSITNTWNRGVLIARALINGFDVQSIEALTGKTEGQFSQNGQMLDRGLITSDLLSRDFEFLTIYATPTTGFTFKKTDGRWYLIPENGQDFLKAISPVQYLFAKKQTVVVTQPAPLPADATRQALQAGATQSQTQETEPVLGAWNVNQANIPPEIQQITPDLIFDPGLSRQLAPHADYDPKYGQSIHAYRSSHLSALVASGQKIWFTVDLQDMLARNKVSHLNGDWYMRSVLRNILDQLPEDTSLDRLTGDSYVFLHPNPGPIPNIGDIRTYSWVGGQFTDINSEPHQNDNPQPQKFQILPVDRKTFFERHPEFLSLEKQIDENLMAFLNHAYTDPVIDNALLDYSHALAHLQPGVYTVYKRDASLFVKITNDVEGSAAGDEAIRILAQAEGENITTNRDGASPYTIVPKGQTVTFPANDSSFTLRYPDGTIITYRLKFFVSSSDFTLVKSDNLLVPHPESINNFNKSRSITSNDTQSQMEAYVKNLPENDIWLRNIYYNPHTSRGLANLRAAGKTEAEIEALKSHYRSAGINTETKKEAWVWRDTPPAPPAPQTTQPINFKSAGPFERVLTQYWSEIQEFIARHVKERNFADKVHLLDIIKANFLGNKLPMNNNQYERYIEPIIEREVDRMLTNQPIQTSPQEQSKTTVQTREVSNNRGRHAYQDSIHAGNVINVNGKEFIIDIVSDGVSTLNGGISNSQEVSKYITDNAPTKLESKIRDGMDTRQALEETFGEINTEILQHPVLSKYGYAAVNLTLTNLTDGIVEVLNSGDSVSLLITQRGRIHLLSSIVSPALKYDIVTGWNKFTSSLDLNPRGNIETYLNYNFMGNKLANLIEHAMGRADAQTHYNRLTLTPGEKFFILNGSDQLLKTIAPDTFIKNSETREIENKVLSAKRSVQELVRYFDTTNDKSDDLGLIVREVSVPKRNTTSNLFLPLSLPGLGGNIIGSFLGPIEPAIVHFVATQNWEAILTGLKVLPDYFVGWIRNLQPKLFGWVPQLSSLPMPFGASVKTPPVNNDQQIKIDLEETRKNILNQLNNSITESLDDSLKRIREVNSIPDTKLLSLDNVLITGNQILAKHLIETDSLSKELGDKVITNTPFSPLQHQDFINQIWNPKNQSFFIDGQKVSLETYLNTVYDGVANFKIVQRVLTQQEKIDARFAEITGENGFEEAMRQFQQTDFVEKSISDPNKDGVVTILEIETKDGRKTPIPILTINDAKSAAFTAQAKNRIIQKNSPSFIFIKNNQNPNDVLNSIPIMVHETGHGLENILGNSNKTYDKFFQEELDKRIGTTTDTANILLDARAAAVGRDQSTDSDQKAVERVITELKGESLGQIFINDWINGLKKTDPKLSVYIETIRNINRVILILQRKFINNWTNHPMAAIAGEAIIDQIGAKEFLRFIHTNSYSSISSVFGIYGLYPMFADISLYFAEEYDKKYGNLMFGNLQDLSTELP